MDRVPSVAAESSTRDLGAFNRWLCTSRLRAAGAVLVFGLTLRLLQPGIVALGPLLVVCGWLLGVSLVGFAVARRHSASMTLFVLQTFADLAAAVYGIGSTVHGVPSLLLRPILAIVIVPASLISVPVGLTVATAASAGHAALLVADRGLGGVSPGGMELLVPPFVFFLIAQQAFFYGAHLERKNTALGALAEEVHAASALKGEFVGAVSHELRSPLNVILGYLEMALAGDLGPLGSELRTALVRARRESLALLEMITALLDLNRFESGRVPVERTPVLIGPLLAELVDQIPPAWRRPDVTLRFVETPGLPVVETDRGKLKTAIRNLVHNALKFTERGEVRVEARVTAGGAVAIDVADTGCGIPPEAIGYVFDMFRQVPGTAGGGVGLGLHIVRRLIDALDGTVTVTSDVAKGTRFTITLPTKTPTPDRHPTKHAA